MGYHTEFRGGFKITPTLKQEDLATLLKLNKDRHEVPGTHRELYPDLSLYCPWTPTKGGEAIVWDGNEKPYRYVGWLKHIILNHLIPKGYKISGEVQWRGEEFGDDGKIVVTENEMKIKGKPGA